MTRRFLLAGVVVSLACRGADSSGPGRIEVEWTGADTGRLQLPATARWCANDSVVEITGASGDSGVALAVLSADTTVEPGVIPVGPPLAVPARPTARVALRWPELALIEGFYGLSGSVAIDSVSGLSGSLRATLRSVNDGREISMNGSFREIRLQEGSPESCGITPAGSPVTRLP